MSFKIPYGYRMDPMTKWSYLNLFYWGRCLKRSFNMWRKRLFYKKLEKLLSQAELDKIHKLFVKENKRHE